MKSCYKEKVMQKEENLKKKLWNANNLPERL